MFARAFSVESLTCIRYEDWRTLPKSSAIYFAFNAAGGVVYIGQTQHLLNRWRVHYRALYHCGVTTIGFVLVPASPVWRLRAEWMLIQRFEPSMHGVRKVMGPKIRAMRGPTVER